MCSQTSIGVAWQESAAGRKALQLRRMLNLLENAIHDAAFVDHNEVPTLDASSNTGHSSICLLFILRAGSKLLEGTIAFSRESARPQRKPFDKSIK